MHYGVPTRRTSRSISDPNESRSGLRCATPTAPRLTKTREASVSHVNRMAVLVLGLGLGLPGVLVAQVGPRVEGLRVESLPNPIGIDVVQPRLSWRIASARRNTMQAAYQLQVATSEASLARAANLLWDSGRMTSDASV